VFEHVRPINRGKNSGALGRWIPRLSDLHEHTHAKAIWYTVRPFSLCKEPPPPPENGKPVYKFISRYMEGPQGREGNIRTGLEEEEKETRLSTRDGGHQQKVCSAERVQGATWEGSRFHRIATGGQLHRPVTASH
jgi:hypothetical protein